MRTLLTLFVILTTSSAHADLTTAQKVNCAAAAIKNILGAEYSVVPESIELKNTSIQKYHVFWKVAVWAAGDQNELNNLSFLAKTSRGQILSGKAVMISSKQSEPYYRQQYHSENERVGL